MIENDHLSDHAILEQSLRNKVHLTKVQGCRKVKLSGIRLRLVSLVTVVFNVAATAASLWLNIFITIHSGLSIDLISNILYDNPCWVRLCPFTQLTSKQMLNCLLSRMPRVPIFLRPCWSPSWTLVRPQNSSMIYNGLLKYYEKNLVS